MLTNKMNSNVNPTEELRFHHIGLLVENIEKSIVNYSQLFGKSNISEVFEVHPHKVKVCFVEMATSGYIELVEPVGDDSVVSKLLKKKVSYYHIGYRVSHISSVVGRLEALNYKAMEYFSSEAFGGKKCIFLFSPEAHLIELIEE